MTIPVKSVACGFSLPAVGLGTWRIGGDFVRNPDNDDDADIAGIRRAIEAGVTHIDTAEMYAGGYCEELISRAIQDVPRESLFLASKVMPEHLGYDDLLHAAEASMGRLGTTSLDLYLVHSPNLHIPMEETMRAMSRLVDEKMVRYIGVSNFTPGRWREAQEHASHPLVVNQVHYNLRFREPERAGLLEECAAHDRLLCAWRPLMWESPQQGVSLLDRLAQKYHKTPNQVAVNWLISQPRVTTIIKMRSAEHIEENLGAIGWQLAPDDIELLRKKFPGQQDVSDAVPLG